LWDIPYHTACYKRYIPEDSTLHNLHYENLISYIKFLYGKAIQRHYRWFEKLRIKKTKLLCALPFLLRCRKGSIVGLHGVISHRTEFFTSLG
jgi:hypothetical protein